MKILLIPTTDWIAHPVPNRLNFIYDRLADIHQIDVCHFKLFKNKKRKTKCNLIEMDDKIYTDVKSYYIKSFFKHSQKISDISKDYDAIISSNILPGLSAALQDIPLIIDFLDYFPESASSYFDPPLKCLARITTDLLMRINLKMADGLITPTRRFKDMLKNYTTSKIHVVPNGVDTKTIKPVDPTRIEKKYNLTHPVIGYVGSLEKWIDLEMIIDIFPSIKKRYSGASLLIVGPGLHTDYSKKLKSRADDLDISDSIIFTGAIPYERLSYFLSAMDVGLNPRKNLKMNTYAMGSKALNYLACGIPVLSKNMPVIEERFSPEKGVFTFDGENDFLGKLHKALKTDIKQGIVKEYDWDILAERYEKVLKELLE